jgi:hypothetical protein
MHRVWQSAVLFAVVSSIWFAGLAFLGSKSGAVASGDRYNLPFWVAGHLSRVWLNPLAKRLGGGYTPATDDEMVRFLSGASAVAAAERDADYAAAIGGDTNAADAILRDRVGALTALDWPVEDRLAGELSTAIANEGLTTSLPLFNRLSIVWPPVAFAYDLPPNLLIESPRGHIELERATLLRSDLASDQIASAEKAVTARGDAGLVVRIGGLAAYPAIVEEDDNYSDALDVLAHEWTHQYLFFHPLGIRYFQSAAMTTINETVANMVGKELSTDVRRAFPLNATPNRVTANAPPPDPTIDVNRVLHLLRVEVDSLLAGGDVLQAEERMRETQQFLAGHGYYLPDINQAYFAFYGSYADTAASSNPIGPRLATLRAQYPNLGAFMRTVQNLRSTSDLVRLANGAAH